MSRWGLGAQEAQEEGPARGRGEGTDSVQHAVERGRCCAVCLLSSGGPPVLETPALPATLQVTTASIWAAEMAQAVPFARSVALFSSGTPVLLAQNSLLPSPQVKLISGWLGICSIRLTCCVDESEPSS